MKRSILATLAMSIPLACAAQSQNVRQAEHGVLVAVSETTVQINPDGSTVTIHRPLDVQKYAAENGLRAVAPGTPVTNSDICGDDDGNGGVPPAGDQWPGPPGPNEPPNETRTTTSRSYLDGWTLSITWGRTVTENPNGGYSDGPWTPIGSSSKGPSGSHTNGNDDCYID